MPSKRTTTKHMSLPSWDLSDLYSGITDPRINAALDTQLRAATAFAKTYRGNISDRTSPASMLKALRTYENIQQETVKPAIYAELIYSVDCQKPEHGAFVQRMEQRTMEIFQTLVFFEVALASLQEKTIRRFAHHHALRRYKHFLEVQLHIKPHRLSEGEEKILNDKYLTGRSRFIRLFNEELATKEFRIPGDKTPYTEPEILDLLHSSDRNKRKAGAKGLTIGLREELRRLTFITNTLLQDKQTDDRYRKFPTPEASRHLSNEITQGMVDAMRSVTQKSYPLVQDFYRFKARVLKLNNLYDYDRYAPIAGSKQNYSFDQAREIVLTSYTSFSPEMANIAKMFFEKQWIDAPPTPGKRGGAYCMFVTPDKHPYVFMNYNGKLNDIKTLAHELGHAVHAYVARKQTYLNFDMPLTVAETASVFGEMLVFDHLRATLTDPQEKFALYMEKIESVFATVHRQIAMYTFEQDLHALSRKNGELSSEDISHLWRKRQTEMFGNAVSLTEDYDIWWSYISHFVHTPFYVYAYAFGELLTLALFALYKRDGKAMTKKYLNMLATGGAVNPNELVQPFGIDLADPAFWQQGMNMIEELIAEAKALYKKL